MNNAIGRIIKLRSQLKELPDLKRDQEKAIELFLTDLEVLTEIDDPEVDNFVEREVLLPLILIGLHMFFDSVIDENYDQVEEIRLMMRQMIRVCVYGIEGEWQD